MAGQTQQERYHLVAALAPLGGWRRMLALDRRGRAAGPLVLSFVPPELTEDPVRLAALSRDAEAGARARHPNLLPVVGLETVEDHLALVEPYRAGQTLRALIDSSGRLPVDLAVRIGCDAGAGLAALHAVDAGDGLQVAHGALTAERVLVAEDGSTLVQGVGTGAGRSVEDDVRALAGVLVEALTGDPPVFPPRKLEAPGVPAPLARLLDRAMGLGEDLPFGDASAFSAALSYAQAPAPVEAMAVYAAAAAPPGAPPPVAPGSGEAPEVSAELIAPVPDGSPAVPTPDPDRTPPPDAAITFPAPQSARAGGRAGRTVALLALLVLGFAGGLGLSRLGKKERAAVAPEPAPVQAPPPVAEPPPVPAPEPARPSPASPPAPQAGPAAPASEARAPAPAPAAKPRPALPSLTVTATPPGEILVDGKLAGRSPLTAEVKPGEHEVRLRDRAQGVDVRRKVTVRPPTTSVRFQLARGTLEVKAPPDTEIWVDGRRVGTGDQQVDLWEGGHEVEVRRAGARTREHFELSPEVSRWTYSVTATE